MHKENSSCCQKPDNLKRTPEECTLETIKQCHGEESSHTCVPEDQKEREKKDKEE